MLNTFLNVSSQVIILLILMALGFILAKTKVLTDSAVKGITQMVLYLVTPCVIIKSFFRKFDAGMLKGLLISFFVVFLLHIGFIIISKLFFRFDETKVKRVLQFAIIFSNCGYMSLPLQQTILGDNGVFYGATYIAVFNLFVWSYGIMQISGDKKYLSPKKVIVNPGIIAFVVGILIFILSVPLPKVIYEPISYLAGLNTPLPMIIIGYHLASTNLICALKNRKCMLAVFLRLLVLPLGAMAVMYACGVRGTLFTSMVIASSAPIAAITTMFSDKFGNDTELSASAVSISTVISLVTMPLLITVAQTIA